MSHHAPAEAGSTVVVNEGPYIIQVIIEDFETSRVIQTHSYTAEKAVKVTVREQKLVAWDATLPTPNPETLYKDKVALVTLESVKKPKPKIKIKQITLEI